MTRALPVALVLCVVAHAHAQEATRIVLAMREPALEVALVAALGPWHVSVIVDDGSAPGASMPSSASRGAALARAHDAAAVAWISHDESGAVALWIYDRESDRVLARPLSVSPPFDEATADAVALSIKTLLRHSSAAPAAERVHDPPAPSELRIELGGGARALATSTNDVTPRGVLAVSFWPRALDSILGFAIAVRAGGDVGLHTSDLDGHWNAFDAHLGVRLRGTPDRLVDLVLGVEIGASVSWIDASVESAIHTSSSSVDPTGYAWLELGVRPIELLRVALRLGTFVAMRTRNYMVRGDHVLSTDALAPIAELVFEVPLDGGRVDAP